MKPTPEHIPFLDYLRGVAILSVFVFHSLLPTFGQVELPWSGWFRDLSFSKSFLLVLPAGFGWVGVPIFFAVSGFCIHLSHQRSRHAGYQVFFLRRFFRIYPPYLLALCLISVAMVADFLLQNSSDYRAILANAGFQFVPHFLLVHNFDHKLFFGINPSFWSIAVEVQLYLLYPLLLWLATRLGWGRALAITGLIEVSSRSVQGLLAIPFPTLELPYFWTGSPLDYWFSWSIGAVLAEAYLKGEPLPFRNFLGFVWPVLWIVSYFFKPLFPYAFTLGALSTACLMSYWLRRPPLFPTMKGWRGYALEHVRQAGIVSYSAYLIHQPLLDQVPKFISLIFRHHAIPILVLYVCCLGSWLPIFGLSYLFYRWVEQPSIAWGKRVIARRKKSTPASPEVLKVTPAS